MIDDRCGLRILVCGGRDYADKGKLDATLHMIHSTDGIAEIVHGGASGADSLAGEWATDQQVPCVVYLADWHRFGSRAGPIRNQTMLDNSQPDYVLAFPGGRGTADMVRRAKAAGVRVLEVK